MRFAGILPLLLIATHGLAAQPVTVVESTDYSRTSLYQEVMDFVYQVQAASDLVAVTALTTSTEGRMIPLVILSKEHVRSPYDLRLTGKPAVLVMANIHAGEVEGKEACQMLIRDIALGEYAKLLDNQVILVLPIFNADGNDKLGKNRRDKGPEVAGVRHNGQNLDLNRDYAKLDSPEVRALVKLFTTWDPVLFMDMHTTNGSYHREPVTYATCSNPNMSQPLFDYMWKKLFPASAATLLQKYKWDSVPYGDFSSREDPTKGWENDTIEARYGTNYFGLRNRLSILNENYSYADFKTRVLGSYGFAKSVLEFTAAHAAEIQALVRKADADTTSRYYQEPFVTESVLDRLFDVTIKGYEYTREVIKPEDMAKYPSWYNGVIIKPTDVPKDYKAPYMAVSKPTKTMPVSLGYVIMPYQDDAITDLIGHGIRVEKLLQGAKLPAERYVIEKIDLAKNLYQGRLQLTFTGHYEKGEIDVPAGAFFVDMRQPLARLIPILLEPASVDSLAAWGFFDRTITRQWSNEPGTYPILRLANRPSVPLVVINPD